MLSAIQDLADRILDRVLGVDPDDELDDGLSGLEQSTSPQLRRIGEILSTLDGAAIETDPSRLSAASTATSGLLQSGPIANIQDLEDLPNLSDPIAEASAPATPSPTPTTAIATDAPSFNLNEPPHEPLPRETAPSAKDLILAKITQAIANPPTAHPPAPPASSTTVDLPPAIATAPSPPPSQPHPMPTGQIGSNPLELAATLLQFKSQPPSAASEAEQPPIFTLLQDMTAIAQAWQQELQQLQTQQDDGPVFSGWLEAEQSPDGTPQYRLCQVHETGRILSQPCPLHQVAPMRQAIARYHQQGHLRDRQRQLQHQLDTLTTALTCLLQHTQHKRQQH